MITNTQILMDGKLHIFLLGTGGPMNNPVRVASSIAIIAAGEMILFDIGPGSYRNADILRLPTQNLSMVFLTHFHSDHIGDLGEANMLSWVNGRENPLEVYGPKGVDKVVNGFSMAYELDTGYRIAHHGSEILSLKNSKMISKEIIINNPSEKQLCFDRNGLQVFAFQVDHSPIKPALGYRIEYEGNVIVITGDTIKTDNLVEQCRNADLLFSEAISFKMLDNIIVGARQQGSPRFAKILKDIQNYHMNPITAAKLANDSEAKKLIIVHITPPLINEKVEMLYIMGMNEIFKGDIILGKDNMKFRLDRKLK